MLNEQMNTFNQTFGTYQEAVEVLFSELRTKGSIDTTENGLEE